MPGFGASGAGFDVLFAGLLPGAGSGFSSIGTGLFIESPEEGAFEICMPQKADGAA